MNEKVREGQRGREGGGGKKETKRKKLRLERNLYSVIQSGVVVLATRQKSYRGA